MENRTPYGNCSGCRIIVGVGIEGRTHQSGTVEHPFEPVFCSKHQVRHKTKDKYKSCSRADKVKDMLSTEKAIEQELIYEEGIKVGLITASELVPMKSQEILLAAGEMTAQELRTVKAVLNWVKRRIEEASCKK